MKSTNCQEIRQLLVEYTDQELPCHDMDMVREHLQSCDACRAALGRLETSLQLCHEVWNEPIAREIPERVALSKSLIKTSLVRGIAALAVAVLLVVSIWPLLRHEETINANGSKTKADSASAQASSDDLTDVQRTISRVSMAARLEASSAALATDPTLAEYRERADRILATKFADLEAGKRAKLRLNSDDNSYQ